MNDDERLATSVPNDQASATDTPADEGYSSPLLVLPGAVNSEGVDAGVALHYGGPFPEQRALEDGRAFTDLSNADVVVVTGEDRLKLLNLLSTQLVEGLRPGQSTELMTLSPPGTLRMLLVCSTTARRRGFSPTSGLVSHSLISSCRCVL